MIKGSKHKKESLDKIARTRNTKWIIKEKQYIIMPDGSTAIKIQLTQGKFAIIDEEDWERVNQYKWYAKRGTQTWYAARTESKRVNKIRDKTIRLHQFLMNCPRDKEVDHINGDGLDCRKKNMRICTRLENGKNQRMPKNNTIGYKGIGNEGNKYIPWVAQIFANGRLYKSRGFKTIKEAAIEYDRLALKYHGEFARLNFPLTKINKTSTIK